MTLFRTTILRWSAAAVLAVSAWSTATADDGPAPSQGPWTFRYKFQPGESVRWSVDQQNTVRTTVSGATQTAETITRSVKVWTVKEVDEKGNATFENSVEKVDALQRLSGRVDVHFNSETDKEPPLGFEQFAASIGVPLSVITLSPTGELVKRQDLRKSQQAQDTRITIPLPENPIAVGESWTFAHDVTVTVKQGGMRKIKTRQVYTLNSVKNDVAVISMETQVLTPVSDPAIEAQLMQGMLTGTVRFDIKAGRVVEQDLKLDRGVVGFSGESSSMRCQTRFSESLIDPAAQRSARRTVLGPEPLKQ
jgi:hypothetical protein